MEEAWEGTGANAKHVSSDCGYYTLRCELVGSSSCPPKSLGSIRPHGGNLGIILGMARQEEGLGDERDRQSKLLPSKFTSKVTL